MRLAAKCATLSVWLHDTRRHRLKKKASGEKRRPQKTEEYGRPRKASKDEAICNVLACSLTGPNDLDNLPTLQPVVSGHGIRHLHARELVLLEPIPF
eukprot:scaffold4543_cov126-Isochrysis_galbana.AAC.3